MKRKELSLYQKEWRIKNAERFSNLRKQWKRKNDKKWKSILAKARKKYKKTHYNRVHKLDMIRQKTRRKYGRLPLGYQYHHFEPYTVDNFIIITEEEHRKIHSHFKKKEVIRQKREFDNVNFMEEKNGI